MRFKKIEIFTSCSKEYFSIKESKPRVQDFGHLALQASGFWFRGLGVAGLPELPADARNETGAMAMHGDFPSLATTMFNWLLAS